MITQWFDPEPTFKGLLFAQELMRQGHQVEVVTGYPNYPGGKVYDGYRITGFRRETVSGVRVLRVPLYPSHDESVAGRIVNYFSFAVAAAVGVLAVRRPDVAYVYHPPATVCLPALLLKAVKGVPYVYDVQDLWPDTLAATGVVTHRPRLFAVIARVMQRVYAGAARVVVLSDGFRDALVARGVPKAKVEVIPNWADEAQINVSHSDACAGSLDSEEDFIVTFAGNLGKAQGLETLLDAAELLRGNAGVKFVVVGAGLEAESLKQQAQRRDLHNMIFLPRRPLSEIGEILTRSDALIVHLRDEPLFSITIPSKTQAYLMAGRPILMGVRGSAARMVEAARAGKAFAPGNATELAGAVLELMSLSPDARQAMGRAGARYYREKLSLKVGTARFAEVLETANLSQSRVPRLKRLADTVLSAMGLVLLAVPVAVLAAGMSVRDVARKTGHEQRSVRRSRSIQPTARERPTQ